jgi:hypothetical protein
MVLALVADTSAPVCEASVGEFGEYNPRRDKILQPYAHYLAVGHLARSLPFPFVTPQANGQVCGHLPGQNEALPALLLYQIERGCAQHLSFRYDGVLL